MTYQRYQRTGLLAIEPHAFLELFQAIAAAAPRPPELIGDVAIVDVSGPLDGPSGGPFDTYAAVRARMAAACALPEARAVVLRVNSPGGDVAGCVDTARALRDAALAAGKPLYAYVDNKACSAAYVLASAAGQISISSCALVGSIGVLSRREDFSARNSATGLRVELITSGARKGDGNPDTAISAEELIAQQAIVDTTARVLCEVIAELRPYLTADGIAALQAGIFVGESAVAIGLADQVESFESLLARVELGGQMGSPYEKALAALQETAKGKDANAAAAKRALAALCAAEPGDDDAEDKDKPADKPDSAESDAPAPDDKKPKPDDQAAADDEEKKAAAAPPAQAAAQASATDLALQALAELHTLKAERKAEKLSAERATLLESRPDFAPELRAVLQSADLATVRKMVETLPKGTATAPAMLGVVSGTRGEGQGGSDHAPNSITAEMDRAMGLTSTAMGVRRQGNTLVFGVQEKPLADKTAAAPAGGAK